MADADKQISEPAEQQITFNVKASSNQTFALSLASSVTVREVKEKLATPEFADIPADRIRLIYSGRVLKDPDTLASCKPAIKDGHTIHMVKGADSNSRQNPLSGNSSAAQAVPAVPANIASGTGHNPLAGLTGARYAGFHGLPNASMFGADGGMGPPPGPEAMLRQLEDPNFAQQMNEAMNNPAVLEMLENSPMMRDNPMMRQLLRDPAMRRMLMNPDMIRMQLQMQSQMGGSDGGAAFPAPGVTDTTPQAGGGAEQTPANNPPTNPLANIFGAPTNAGAANPFAMLFPGAAGAAPSASPPSAAGAGRSPPSTNTDQTAANPFANLFPNTPGGAGGGSDPLTQMAAQMMQNPEMMRSAMQMFGGMNNPTSPLASTGAGTEAGAEAGAQNPNPFAAYGNMFQGLQTQTPPDTRPPEERYEAELRTLNEMGFYNFDTNVAALRRSGGNVQGAIEFLLGA